MPEILEFPTLDTNRTIRQPLGSEYQFTVIVEEFAVLRAGQWVKGIDVEISRGPRIWQSEFTSMALAEVAIGEKIVNWNRELGEEYERHPRA